MQTNVTSNSAELMKQAVKRDQGIAFLTAFNVLTEVSRLELVFVPIEESVNQPLHLIGIVKTQHQLNLMTKPFISAFERLARLMLVGSQT